MQTCFSLLRSPFFLYLSETAWPAHFREFLTADGLRPGAYFLPTRAELGMAFASIG
ncbi:MAG: hypothetical protein JWM11_1018 [Planctomycetaceae bacterium]|nr:hypothetical protein [Planctomycetaceae bacterium]